MAKAKIKASDESLMFLMTHGKINEYTKNRV